LWGCSSQRWQTAAGGFLIHTLGRPSAMQHLNLTTLLHERRCSLLAVITSIHLMVAKEESTLSIPTHPIAFVAHTQPAVRGFITLTAVDDCINILDDAYFYFFRIALLIFVQLIKHCIFLVILDQ
jgi:hypothetical protein